MKISIVWLLNPSQCEILRKQTNGHNSKFSLLVYKECHPKIFHYAQYFRLCSLVYEQFPKAFFLYQPSHQQQMLALWSLFLKMACPFSLQ